MESLTLLSTHDIAKHNSSGDCWLVVEGDVWDVTGFAPQHPGGASLILKHAGRDATKAYAEYHASGLIEDTLPSSCLKGKLDRSTIDEIWTRSQSSPTKSSSHPTQPQPDDQKPPLHSIINSYDFEEIAARTAPKKAYTFYSTAATDCWTRDMNESMYKRIWFRPRILHDVSRVDTSTTILGNKVKVPIFICPTGLAKMIHPEAEKALARAAKATGIIEILSTSASHPVEDIVAQAPDHPFFFQLYVNRDRKKSEELLAKVNRLGLKAVFVTVDAAGRGKRESDERLVVDEPVINPVTGEPDAKLAMQYGVNGILLSNHGGRNLDYSPPAILVLLEMHKLCPEIFDRMEVYVDGGIRRGGDVIKALCLGATAVGIGRTFLYALNYGSEGAEHLVELLKDEMESVMKLIGITNLSECHSGLVNTLDVDHLVPTTDGHPYAKWRPKPRL
ncbi:hypothetical protein LTR48_000776 [Friedmanniomyces endolithicus]|uniref:Cytochrome b2, mitochondrial n=1 Tax=Rachicladosporium monterosium TaxID=1507873 RepID=A0ABR0LGL7_9PEZI|nr:hypothetical protein LTR48_000776 [Friedmanniomyces endolithicus]KAK5147662.1 hypothetical protein LTR32_000942 [Rachicladosporium monterosium]